MDDRVQELDGSRVIWTIMAVSALWLVGLLVLAIGYTVFECIGPCQAPAPVGVWWITLALAAVLFAASGRVAVRMTSLTWTAASAVPGIVLVALLAI